MRECRRSGCSLPTCFISETLLRNDNSPNRSKCATRVRLNFDTLRAEADTLVIDGFHGEDPLSVIVPYKVFLRMQEERLGQEATWNDRKP